MKNKKLVKEMEKHLNKMPHMLFGKSNDGKALFLPFALPPFLSLLTVIHAHSKGCVAITPFPLLIPEHVHEAIKEVIDNYNTNSLSGKFELDPSGELAFICSCKMKRFSKKAFLVLYLAAVQAYKQVGERLVNVICGANSESPVSTSTRDIDIPLKHRRHPVTEIEAEMEKSFREWLLNPEDDDEDSDHPF